MATQVGEALMTWGTWEKLSNLEEPPEGVKQAWKPRVGMGGRRIWWLHNSDNNPGPPAQPHLTLVSPKSYLWALLIASQSQENATATKMKHAGGKQRWAVIVVVIVIIEVDRIVTFEFQINND